MSTALHVDSTFQLRSCPFCGSDAGQVLFDLKAEQYCSANWTYAKNYPTLLQISKDEKFPVDRCGSCGFVYARLLPSQTFLARVYDEVIDPVECRKGSENPQSYVRRLHYIATLLALSPESTRLRALDFGCGLGVSVRFLNAAGVDVVGYDPSRTRIEAVKAIDGIVATNEEELIDLGLYDILICDNVLEHLPNPGKTLEMLASISGPETVLYVSVPSYEKHFVQRQLNALKNRLPIDMTLNPWEHLNYFDLSHLDRLLARYGFTPILANQLPAPVNIGLRPEVAPLNRFKNTLASFLRMVRYAAVGKTSRSVESGFYRLTGNV
jgi:SAM-dependent methyltransferase